MVFDLSDLMFSNLRLDLIAADLIAEMGLYRPRMYFEISVVAYGAIEDPQV
jgi:hypothetical protein